MPNDNQDENIQDENLEENQDENIENDGAQDGADENENQDDSQEENQDENADDENQDEEEEIDEDEEPELNEEGSSNSDDEDSEFDPYDPEKAKEFIKKQTEKANEPLKEQLFQQKVESKLSKILTDNPEYAPYEKRIRNFVNHPNRAKMIRQGLPVNTVVLEAVAPYLQKMGAKKAKIADAEADKTKSNGNNKPAVEPKGGNKYAGMSNDEISKMADQVKSGRYKE